MTIEYRVVVLATDTVPETEHRIFAASVSAAALRATGETLVRSGRAKDLRAKVYFQPPGDLMTMVRLYRSRKKVAPAPDAKQHYLANGPLRRPVKWSPFPTD